MKLSALIFLIVLTSSVSAEISPNQDKPAEGEIGTDPLMVDPLLGMELEAMRRLVQRMDARIDALEARIKVLEEK